MDLIKEHILTLNSVEEVEEFQSEIIEDIEMYVENRIYYLNTQ